jgi:hypothetical protein
MAGYRRRTGRSTVIDRRRENRSRNRDRHMDNVAKAETPSARVAAAAAYYRSALRAVRLEVAEQSAADAVPLLIGLGDALLKPKKGSR